MSSSHERLQACTHTNTAGPPHQTRWWHDRAARQPDSYRRRAAASTPPAAGCRNMRRSTAGCDRGGPSRTPALRPAAVSTTRNELGGPNTYKVVLRTVPVRTTKNQQTMCSHVTRPQIHQVMWCGVVRCGVGCGVVWCGMVRARTATTHHALTPQTHTHTNLFL